MYLWFEEMGLIATPANNKEDYIELLEILLRRAIAERGAA